MSQKKIDGCQQIERGLKVSRQILQDMLDVLPVYVILLDPDYYVPFENRFFRERFGPSNGKRCFEYLFGRSEPCEICETYRVLNTGEPHRWEWTGPDGQDYDIYDFPFTDRDGSQFILEMGMDITERKRDLYEIEKYRDHLEELVRERTGRLEKANIHLRSEIAERRDAEESLLRERALLAAIMDATDVMLVYLDGDFNFLSVNQAYADSCRMKPQDMIGKNHFALYPHEENEAIFRRVRDTGEAVFYKDKPFRFTDQPERGITYWDWSLVPVSGEGDSIGGLVFSLRETTDYKLAELALKESEERFRTLAEAQPQIVWTADPEGVLRWFNRHWYEYTGEEPGAGEGQTWDKLAHPDDRTKILENWQKACHTGELFQSEIRVRRYDGQYRWLLVRVWPMKDESDKISGWYGINTDINEVKLAEQKIRESEERLRLATDLSGTGVFEWNVADDSVLWENDRMYEIFGHTLEDGTINKEQFIADYIHRDDVFSFEEALKGGAESPDRMFHSLVRIRRKNEIKWRWLEFSGRFESADGSRELLKMIGVVRDITERKESENILQASEKLLKETQKIAHLGSWELDLVHNRLTWSDEVYRIFGMDPREFGATYEAFLERVHPEDRTALNSAYSDSLREGKDIYEIEHRIIRKDTGEIRTVYEKCNHIRNSAGQIIHSVGVVHDITEQKKNERALQWNLRRNELLSGIAGHLLENVDPQSIINDICRQVMEFLDCHTFFNYLVDEEGDRLYLNSCAGIPPEEACKIKWLDYGAAVCGCVARDCRRIIAEDIQNTTDIQTELVRSYGIQAYCCHPLMDRSRLIGTISFGTRTGKSFTEDEISVMKSVSTLVAVAMARIRKEAP